MAVAMSITGIRDNVDTLLDNFTYKNKFDQDVSFVNVLKHAPDEDYQFEGYPSAAHYYVDSQNEYATVTQNRRVYEYVVELYIMSNDNPEDEYDDAYRLIDSIISMFDKSIDLSSNALGLARACDIMRPTPSELVRIKLNEGVGFVTTLRLFCEADTTFRNS